MKDPVTINVVFIYIIINSLGNSLGKNSPLKKKLYHLRAQEVLAFACDISRCV